MTAISSREEFVAFQGEQWALHSDPRRNAGWVFAPPAEKDEKLAQKIYSESLFFYCWLHFRLVGNREREPGWHKEPPRLMSALRGTQGELLGKFYPFKQAFQAIPMYGDYGKPMVVEDNLEFKVLQRRLSVLLLEGPRGLLDYGQNVGLYYGSLGHADSEDLDNLGFEGSWF